MAQLVIPVLPPVIGEPAEYNSNYILFWNSVALDLGRLATSLLNSPGNTPPSASRFLAILHLALNDVYFSIHPDKTGVATTYLTPDNSDPSFDLPPLDGASDAEQGAAGAAITVLNQLYVSIPIFVYSTCLFLKGHEINRASLY
jgi:vanadium chloroperoxidase